MTSANRPSYACFPIAREIVMTGKIDDPLWETAPVARLTHPVTGEPQPHAVMARLLYSRTSLYIAFHCETDYIEASYTEHDSPVWEECCCEVFLCPSGKMRQYYELNVNPLNTMFDAFILNGTPEIDDPQRRLMTLASYTCHGAETQVHIDGVMDVIGGVRSWSVEYAIPFASLIGADRLLPAAGDAWCMNLCAIASPKPGEEQTYYSWAMMGKIDFHLPWRFGVLRFC